MAKTGRFWRNVVLIALVHVALIAVMIRWSLAARASTNAESIVWLGGGGDFAAGEPANEPSSAAKPPITPEESKSSKEDEENEKKPAVVTAKSEIELSSATPKPTSTAASMPKPTATPTAKSRSRGTTPKPTPKPTPKKTLVAEGSPRPSPKTKTSAVKSSEKSDKNKKNTLAKNELQSQTGSGKIASTGKGASAGGGSGASEFGWYGNMLHDRFYRAWIQPTAHVPSGSKISTLVKIRIEKDGHVSKFEIIKPSGNVVVNESVRVVAKQITQVDAPPAGLIKGDHYDVKINFELNTAEPGER
jgi:outer membrane biosynthesis protein TonB